MAVASTPALAVLDAAGVPYRVHRYQHNPQAHQRGLGYGDEAAVALKLDPAVVFKTLIVTLTPAGHGVVLVPAHRMTNLKAVAALLGAKKAELCEPLLAQRLTGFVVGGISPLGQRTQLPTVLDDSALNATVIYISAGRRGTDVSVQPQDLITLTNAIVGPVATPEQQR